MVNSNPSDEETARLGPDFVCAQTPARKKPAKQRLGETSQELWQAMKRESLGGRFFLEAGSRLLYPTLRVVCGQDFILDVSGKLMLVPHDGNYTGHLLRDCTEAEIVDFHRDLDQDRVQVLYLSAPGYASGYRARSVIFESHSPSGLAFA